MAAFKIPFDLAPDVAIARARAAGVLAPDVFYSLPAEKRAHAFTVSGLAKLDQVQAVADKLAQMQAEGNTLADFQKWSKTQDWTLPRHRLETIYRNAVQTAYQAGHWRSFEENAKALPYLMYDAINDSRVRPSHLALDGVIKPVGDPFWKTHACPNGHRCRCGIKQLSSADAMSRGGVTQNVPAEGVADDGWGHKPTDGFRGLLGSIQNRLNKCSVNMSVTFANVRGTPPLHCTEPVFRDHLLSVKAFAQDNGQLPQPQQIMPLEKIHGGSAKKAFSRFMQEFGGGNEQEFETVLGNRYTLLIDNDPFLDKDKKGWKIKNEGRQLRILYNAAAIKAPDEIIFEPARKGQEFLWFFARYEIERGLILSTVATFERKAESNHLWTGNTAYNSLDRKHIFEIRNSEIVNGSVLYHRWK